MQLNVDVVNNTKTDNNITREEIEYLKKQIEEIRNDMLFDDDDDDDANNQSYDMETTYISTSLFHETDIIQSSESDSHKVIIWMIVVMPVVLVITVLIFITFQMRHDKGIKQLKDIQKVLIYHVNPEIGELDETTTDTLNGADQHDHIVSDDEDIDYIDEKPDYVFVANKDQIAKPIIAKIDIN